jgi:cell division transport system permease protein
MKRNFLVTSTFLVTSLVYFFALASWISIQSFTHLINRWSHQSEMTIYFRPDATDESIQKVKATLASYAESVSSHFESSDSIRDSLKKIMPKSELDFAGNDELVAAIPPHFIVKGEVNLVGSSLFEIFEAISKDVRKNPGVDSTSYGKSWAEKYTIMLQSLNGVTIGFFMALAFTLVLVIGNAIRSHIYNRREEIEILELVGATSSMIRKPFLVEGVLLSLGAMSFALTLSTTLTYFLKNHSLEVVGMLDFTSALWLPTVLDWMGALIFAASIGLVGSYLCLTEINTGWAASGQSRNILPWMSSLSKKGH